MHRAFGYAHARILGAIDTLRSSRGQGTVEYVALILLVAVVLAGVVAATKKTSLGSGDIGKAIMEKIKDAMDSVSK